MKREQINIRLDKELKNNLNEIKSKIKKSSGFEITITQIMKRALEELNKSLK